MHEDQQRTHQSVTVKCGVDGSPFVLSGTCGKCAGNDYELPVCCVCCVQAYLCSYYEGKGSA